MTALFLISFFLGRQWAWTEFNNPHNKRMIDKDTFTPKQTNAILDYFNFSANEKMQINFARYKHGQDPALVVWISVIESKDVLLEKNTHFKQVQQGMSIYDYASDEYYNSIVAKMTKTIYTSIASIACVRTQAKFVYAFPTYQ